MKNIRQSFFKSTSFKQRGFTMVEILVALVISLFLVAGVIQLFIGSKQTYRGYDALSRIQENGRFALEAMARDIRMARYFPRVVNQPVPNSTVTELTVMNQNGVPWPDPFLLGAAPIIGVDNGNTDSIAIQWLANDGVTFNSRRYSIGNRTGLPVTCPEAATSLRVNQNDGNGAQELIEGVRSMEILYGEDTAPAGTPPTPSVARLIGPAGGVTNWNNVVSVQINLLVVGLEGNLVTTPQSVNFSNGAGGQTNVILNNRCLGQVFSTTIALRN
ncbi:MAG: PilW family protein [Candidatus Competibacteraceae bacterium]|nr:PilW family protein [Candidatus Competibacteraceae bacterium]